MVEWIALVISIIAILLEKEKIINLFTDLTGWASRKKYEIEGRQFVKNITSSGKDNGLRIVFTALFFFYLISSGLSGLLEANSVETFSAISTLTFLPLLILTLRGFFRRFRELRFGLLMAFMLGIMVLWTFAGMGMIWGIITMGFLSINLPVFWAGFLATPCVLALLWLAQYHSSKTWAKNMDT